MHDGTKSRVSASSELHESKKPSISVNQEKYKRIFTSMGLVQLFQNIGYNVGVQVSIVGYRKLSDHLLM